MPNTDKTILLPQLQRYDQKIKGWADAKFLTKADTPSLPKATATTLGGVKVGNGLNVTDDGILSAKTHGSETSITTSITATLDNTGTWNAVCKDTYNVIVSWFDNYDRVFAWVNSSENSLRPFPQVFVELVKIQKGPIVSTPFTIQYVVRSNNPRVRTGMTTTSLCQIYFDANGSIDFQESYSEVDQYADATEFTNTVNEDVSMLALKEGGITSAKLADGAVTAAKIADGAITKDKLASDVGAGGSIAEATEKTSGVVYAKVNPRIPPTSLGHVYSLQNSGLHIESINNGVINTEHLANYAVTAGKVANNAITAAKLSSNSVTTKAILTGAVTSTKLAADAVTTGKIADGAVTADKIANGAITADKLASGVGGGAGGGGGGSIFNLGSLSKGTILSIVSFDCGNFIMYLVSFIIEPTPSGIQIRYNLHGTDLLISPKSTGTVHIVPPSSRSGFYSYTLTWFQPKSASAKAALTTLLPVQDECEQMEAEVAKLEQDWIDNQDETVAVDGNGVPITIATKKTELEKKQAELEKLREDYFSKLGDWKNEVQE